MTKTHVIPISELPLPGISYRYGTKMRQVYKLFSDGLTHGLDELVPIVKGMFSPNTPANRRTASSFVRTLRRKFTVERCYGQYYRITGTIVETTL
jgi:hypothetical protein